MSDERELERDAEAVRAAYRKLPRAEPPPALDRAVLAQARAAVQQSKSGDVRRPRWLLPVGLAATAVLAIGVASRMGKEPEDRWREAPAAPALQAPEVPAPKTGAEAPAEAPAGASASSAVEGDSKRALDEAAADKVEAKKSDLGRLQDKDAESGLAAPAANNFRKARAAPEQAREDRPAAEAPQKMRAQAQRREVLEQAPPPVVEDAPEQVIEESRTVAAPEPFPGRDDNAKPKEAQPEAERQRYKQEAPAAARPAYAPAPAPAPAPASASAPAPPAPVAPVSKSMAAPAPAVSGERRNAEVRSPAAADQLEAAQSKAAITAQGGASADTRTEAAGSLRGGNELAIDPAERQRPDTWLEAIRRLVASGREDDARRELHRFQREHPSHAIPQDLQRLAE